MSQFDRAINMGGPVNTAVDRGDHAERRLGVRFPGLRHSVMASLGICWCLRHLGAWWARALIEGASSGRLGPAGRDAAWPARHAMGG